jgi:hypothetical protein
MAISEAQVHEPIHPALLVQRQTGLIAAGTKSFAKLRKYGGAEYASQPAD